LLNHLSKVSEVLARAFLELCTLLRFILYDKQHFFKAKVHFQSLTCYRLQRVSQLVRHRCICDCQELLFCINLVEANRLGDIEHCNHDFLDPISYVDLLLELHEEA